MNKFSVAIDGPAGAGKSTIAKLLAKRLSFVYIDTGAMYRAIGYFAYNHVFNERPFEINEESIKLIEAYLHQHLNNLKLTIDYIEDEQHIYMNDVDVTELIRSQEIGTMASVVSTNREVRVFLVREQQRLAEEISVVMDGRDIGTHVLPQAPVKIFLTASTDIRAKRRYDQLVQRGDTPDFQQLKTEIEERDYRDMTRDYAPLCKADDAIELDSSTMLVEEVVDFIYDRVIHKQTNA